MKFSLRKALSAVLLAGAISANAGVFAPNWYTDASGTIQFFNPDGLTKLGGSFVVEVGIFASTPDFSNTTTLPTFTSLGITAWDPNIIAPGVGGASLSLSFDSTAGYPPTVNAGAQIYAWVYNSKSVVGSSSWAVITNSSWVLPAIPAGASVSTLDWTITDPGTQVRFGTLVGDKITLSTAVVIPEPSTYALILGALTLGIVGVRRWRK